MALVTRPAERALSDSTAQQMPEVLSSDRAKLTVCVL